ncbi:MAG: Rap1a/Tai family immunity protein [Candidatus Eiseniibacteriota bacterium]
MILRNGFLAGVVLAALSAPASAGFTDGNKLYQDCTGMLTMLDSSCAAYISAVADMLATGPVGRHRACLPNGVKLGQAVDVVKQWLNENPQSRHLPGPEVVSTALERAFPCKGSL